MSANINSMMYVGEKPWHSLGTKLENAATAEEAILAAGLNWKVEKEQVYLKDGRPVRDCFATIRQDNKSILGTVGSVYRPLQNKEAFSFFDAVVGEKLAIYHTAGALGDGEKVWILAKLPGTIQVTGDDITEKYLLLSNSHDGTSAINVLWTPVRVVCQNTLNIALFQAGKKKSSIRHTSLMGTRIDQVRESLGIVHNFYAQFEETAKLLASKQCNTEGWRKMLKEIGIIPHDELHMKTRAENIIEEVSALFEGGQKGGNMPGVKGTAWGAFNAVAEYADFHRSTKGADKIQARAASLLFGSSKDLKQKAWDSAVSML